MSKLIRRKRGDTKIGTIEKIYGRDFGTRSDAKLGNFLEKNGYDSLSELLRKDDKKRSR